MIALRDWFMEHFKTGVTGLQFPLYSPRQLPELEGESLILTWDQVDADSIISHKDIVIWREKTGWEVYDRFEEIVIILKHKYGSCLADLIPTLRSLYALYGDSSAASAHVAHARQSLAADVPAAQFHWVQLQTAIREGDARTIQQYLAQGGDPNVRTTIPNSTDTLLHVAARHRQSGIAFMLIAAHADVNATDVFEHPPLVEALDTRFMPAVGRNPARCGFNPEALQVERTTALVRILVLAGANLSGLNRPFSQLQGLQREMYRPPLIIAAHYGYIDALRFMLAQGAAIDEVDHFGDTPLIMALRWGQTEAVRQLLAAGADINRVPYHPDNAADSQIQLVIKSGRFDPADKPALIQRMIDAGADVNAINAVGDSALLTAVRFGTDYYYAFVTITDRSSNSTVQVEAFPVQHKLPPAPLGALIGLFKAANADMNVRDRDGKTARELAAAAGLSDVANLLV